jgi:hypothetical protein
MFFPLIIILATTLVSWSAVVGFYESSPEVLRDAVIRLNLGTAPQPVQSDKLPLVFSTFAADAKAQKEAILAQLGSSWGYFNRAYEVDAEGKISRLIHLVAAKGKHIIVQQDYSQYKQAKINGENVDVGFLIRVQAELVTKSANVDLNGPFDLGVALKAGSVTGDIHMAVYGLSGEPITAAIPGWTHLSEASLQNTIQAVATIKAKTSDEKVTVTPQVIPDLVHKFTTPSTFARK